MCNDSNQKLTACFTSASIVNRLPAKGPKWWKSLGAELEVWGRGPQIIPSKPAKKLSATAGQTFNIKGDYMEG